MSQNYTMLESTIAVLQKKGKEKQVELADKEIELPLTPILMEDLPSEVPGGTVEALKPIIEDYEFEQQPFNAERLFDES